MSISKSSTDNCTSKIGSDNIIMVNLRSMGNPHSEFKNKESFKDAYKDLSRRYIKGGRDDNSNIRKPPRLPMINNNDVEALEKQDTQKKNQYIAATCAALGAICAGTTLAWSSPALPQLVVPAGTNTSRPGVSFQLTEAEGSLVGSMLAIGALFSAIPAGFIADKFGRKQTNLMLVVPYTVCWLLTVFATNAYMLYAARFFAGLATGAICVTAPMYIGEIAEPSIRGTLGTFFQLFMCLGILATYVIGAFINWVGLSAILAMAPIIFASSLWFMPETPIFLVKIRDLKGAEESLKYLRGAYANVRSELKVIDEEVSLAQSKKVGFKDLFGTRANRIALVTGLGLQALQQLSGINAVIFYTVPIFKSAGSTLPPNLAAVVVSIVQTITCYFAAMVIDKANRRFFLTVSSVGMTICLTALGCYYHLILLDIHVYGLGILPLGSLVLFIMAYSIGFGPVPWMIMSEIFAPEIRGFGSGLAVTTNWINAFIVTFSFPIMNAILGGHITFYIFSIIMGLATIFVYAVVPETRGKSVTEIQNMLNKS
ncbi:facilitated trehalose transporter Tret1-2 homolog isoform X2 [Agrilus planipennis]|uniref:Facilitated trehalose transporter Tret1-2 homolog isoform X2 n=1 Tax=Agrilus planipennis TaxID=224129 RepID=A0A1W4XL19_AGRPL|nr:facilitated trehalose transporter Tret1-2 homolog isoform X2 [Agrilus planipennis]